MSSIEKRSLALKKDPGGFCQTGVPCEDRIPHDGERSIDQVES